MKIGYCVYKLVNNSLVGPIHFEHLRQSWFLGEQGALDALDGTSLKGDFVILKQIYK
jgi:hypothetical protein